MGLVELIAEYLISTGGPDRGTRSLWFWVAGSGLLICLLIIGFTML